MVEETGGDLRADMHADTDAQEEKGAQTQIKSRRKHTPPSKQGRFVEANDDKGLEETRCLSKRKKL